jgi:hypothetical protein
MMRLVLVLALAAVAALLGHAAWRHHLRAPAPEPAFTTAPAPASPASVQRRKDGSIRSPLGAEPTHAEIEQLVRRQFDELNRNGGMTLALSATGQRLPSAFFDVRGFRFDKPCEPHDKPTEHPHWSCAYAVEIRGRGPYDEGFKWNDRQDDISRFPDGGIDTLQEVVRWERGQRPR